MLREDSDRIPPGFTARVQARALRRWGDRGYCGRVTVVTAPLGQPRHRVRGDRDDIGVSVSLRLDPSGKPGRMIGEENRGAGGMKYRSGAL